MAEGVGLLPTNRKTLKINGRFRRYVLHDYRTGVAKQGSIFHSELAPGLQKAVSGVNES